MRDPGGNDEAAAAHYAREEMVDVDVPSPDEYADPCNHCGTLNTTATCTRCGRYIYAEKGHK